MRGRLTRTATRALLAIALLAAVVYGSAFLLTDRFAWARAVAWGESDVDDRFRFPERLVAKGDDTSPLRPGAEPAALSAPVNVDLVGRPIDDLLQKTGTRAFLVVHHDQLVYERYFGGADAEQRQTSFSATKSFLSTLVGIAADEGLLKLTDPVTAYLPELAERDKRFEVVTVRDLLTMSAGLHYTEQGMPWSDDALTYYGTDLRDLALTHTEVEEPPGTTWRYNNYNPLLLGLVLERATKMPVAEYLATRLWQPLGAEEDATWSTDSTKSGFEKMESGINARPADYARFGLMMLHDGRWNGHQIVSPAWVREATAASTEHDPADFYQYLWWVGPRPEHGRAPFYAVGKYGQVVAVFPQHDLVIVRLGTTDGGVNWMTELRDVADRIAEEE
jgi:CubicO group peptidase (beta-lactamase class C family)